MLGGDEEKDPDAAKKEEERQEALRQEEEERKAKYAKMEAEREAMRQGIRDKVGTGLGTGWGGDTRGPGDGDVLGFLRPPFAGSTEQTLGLDRPEPWGVGGGPVLSWGLQAPRTGRGLRPPPRASRSGSHLPHPRF